MMTPQKLCAAFPDPDRAIRLLLLKTIRRNMSIAAKGGENDWTPVPRGEIRGQNRLNVL